MKHINALFIAAAPGSLSFASVAAVEVQATPTGQQAVGSISTNAGSNLDSLQQELAQKADAAGAKSFRITSLPLQ